VILCRRGSAEKALYHLHEIMGKLKLTVNGEKTRICRVPDFYAIDAFRVISAGPGFGRPRRNARRAALLVAIPRGPRD